MSYIKDLEELVNPSFDKLYEIAVKNLSTDKRIAPWRGLNHGIKLLENDDELAQYLLAYGKIHKAKVDEAIDTIENPTELFSRRLTIIDWGCGQGLATICFFDYLRENNIEPDIKEIILIEPSLPTIERASANITQYGFSQNIRCLNKYIDDVNDQDIDTDSELILNFFSNILDIPTINLEHLHTITTANKPAEQLFFCVSPQNLGASRIKEFANLFDIQEKDLLGQRNGLLDGRGTISMLVFRLCTDIPVPEVVKVVSKVYRNRKVVESNLQKVIRNKRKYDKIENQAILFYKMLIELERYKSIDKIDIFNYPTNITLHDKIVNITIDIKQNESFTNSYKDNLKAQWPKNLLIGICFALDNNIYRLLQYVQPIEDIKDFNIDKNVLSIPLNSFSVNRDLAEELGITHQIAEDIDVLVSEPTITLDTISQILKDAIDKDICLAQDLQLALTAQTPVLSQIRSELNKLESTPIPENNLLTDFLRGCLPNNTIADIDKDTIIPVIDMDDAQRTAIQTALNSQLSVITGPPGTGKTQMILNLLINAFIHGKSVLVASKNNKAVDNVKDRYDNIDPHEYMLRWGSRENINTLVIPALDGFNALIPNLNKNNTNYNNLQSQYKVSCDCIVACKKDLQKLKELQEKLSGLQKKEQDLQSQRKAIQSQYENAVSDLNNRYTFAYKLEYTPNTWTILQQQIQSLLQLLSVNRGSFKTFCFNLFKLAKCRKDMVAIYTTLPITVQNRLKEDRPIVLQKADIKQLCSFCENMSVRLDQLKQYNDELNQVEKVYNTHNLNMQKEFEAIAKQQNQTKLQIDDIGKTEEQLNNEFKNNIEEIKVIGKDLFESTILYNLIKDNSRSAILRYKQYLPNNIPWREDEYLTYQQNAQHFIDIFKLNTVTNLSVKNAFPLTNDLFDIVIIDEASQCDVASALPLIYRAKQLVVIGDPLQLKHITSINIQEEGIIREWNELTQSQLLKYVDYSLYDYCRDLITNSSGHNSPVILNCHYRCHPDIINYSNEMFYKRRLQQLKILTPKQQEIPDLEQGMTWIDVAGEQKSKTENINYKEIDVCISIAIELTNKYPDLSIGIISPFKHQVEEIRKTLSEINNGDKYLNRITIDTVHKFQGDEKDIIIYSLVVTDNSPESKIKWIDQNMPNLVNVAITRARKSLYVVGNKKYISLKSTPKMPLGFLLKYIENGCRK